MYAVGDGGFRRGWVRWEGRCRGVGVSFWCARWIVRSWRGIVRSLFWLVRVVLVGSTCLLIVVVVVVNCELLVVVVGVVS